MRFHACIIAKMNRRIGFPFSLHHRCCMICRPGIKLPRQVSLLCSPSVHSFRTSPSLLQARKIYCYYASKLLDRHLISIHTISRCTGPSKNRFVIILHAYTNVRPWTMHRSEVLHAHKPGYPNASQRRSPCTSPKKRSARMQ